MNFLLVLLPLISLSVAQRPTYAGTSSKGYPELASRFQDPDLDQNNTGIAGIGNRIGDDDQPPQNLPTDARGDTFLVNRLNQWPRENRPFWLINSQHIEQHRHPEQQLNQQGVQQTTVGNNLPTGGQPTSGSNQGTIQSRFGEPGNSETRTVKPQSQRGFFAGTRQ